MFCSRCLVEVPDDQHLDHTIEHIERMERKIMTAFGDVQASIDQLTTTVNDQATQIATDTTAIQTEIAGLQGGTVDLSGLQEAVATLGNNVTALAALVPAPAPSE